MDHEDKVLKNTFLASGTGEIPLPEENMSLTEEEARFAEKDDLLFKKAQQWKWEIPIPL